MCCTTFTWLRPCKSLYINLRAPAQSHQRLGFGTRFKAKASGLKINSPDASPALPSCCCFLPAFPALKRQSWPRGGCALKTAVLLESKVHGGAALTRTVAATGMRVRVLRVGAKNPKTSNLTGDSLVHGVIVAAVVDHALHANTFSLDTHRGFPSSPGCCVARTRTRDLQPMFT